MQTSSFTRLLTILTCAAALSFHHTAEAGFVAVDPFENGSSAGLSLVTAMVGWSFAPTVNIAVTQLGYYDFGGNGLGESHEVGIWANGGALLGSATVATGDPILDNFRYTPSPAINLTAGQTYVIGGYQTTAGRDDLLTGTISVSGFSTAPQITYGGQRATLFAAAFSRPDGTYSGATDGIWGPNFQFEVATTVPEPGTALFGLALLGAALTRRARRS